MQSKLKCELVAVVTDELATVLDIEVRKMKQQRQTLDNRINAVERVLMGIGSVDDRKIAGTYLADYDENWKAAVLTVAPVKMKCL